MDIQTEAPGFTAQQVEQLVTKPIENAVNGANGLATIRSQSIPGLSVIKVPFADNVNLYTARQGISERLSELGSSLPLGVGTPKLSPLTSSTMDLLKIGLNSDKLDAFSLRDAADWVMKPALLAVPGVAHVIVYGGAVRQIQIQPDLARMTSYGVTLTEIADAARAALSLKGAGFGLEPLLLQSAWFRPHNRSEDVAGLYLVGASTQPGAGVPGVVSSAKATVDLVLRDFA